MLQAIGEGVDLLERYRDRLDIAAVLALLAQRLGDPRLARSI